MHFHEFFNFYDSLMNTSSAPILRRSNQFSSSVSSLFLLAAIFSPHFENYHQRGSQRYYLIPLLKDDSFSIIVIRRKKETENGKKNNDSFCAGLSWHRATPMPVKTQCSCRKASWEGFFPPLIFRMIQFK